jgi:hypothetical protein
MGIERTSAGLAAVMFDELDALKAGTSTPQAARAKASIANTIVGISRLEMDFARFVADANETKNIKRLQNLRTAEL